MFENEMMGNEEESGVETGVSQEHQSEAQTQGLQEGQEAQGKPESKETSVPFHEHPRWKEIMGERDAERQRVRDYEAKVREMERRLEMLSKPSEKPVDPMYEKLKGIDPEFAEYMQQLKTRAEKSEALETRLNQFEQAQFVNSALSRFNELNKEYKVPKEVSELYEAKLDLMYRDGKIRNLQDLEAAYKSLHEPYNKMITERERQVLEKYTKEKKQDASRPVGQSKGRAPTPGQQAPKETLTKEQLREKIVGQLKASRAATN